MRKFLVLLKKEVRELLTPQILLPFVLTVVLFALMGSFIGQQGEETRESQRLGIVDLDGGEYAAVLVGAVEEAGFNTIALDARDSEDMSAALRDRDMRLGLVIPEGFSSGISAGTGHVVGTYVVLRNFSVMGSQEASILKTVIGAVNHAISLELVARNAGGGDPSALLQPVSFEEEVTVGDRTAKVSAEEVLGFISQQTTFIPIILFIVIIFAAQMIATTIASEKENKTLETLLASPVSRASLLTAKMLAAAIVAALSAGAYMVGLRYYFQGLEEGLGGDALLTGSPALADVASRLGLALEAPDWALLGFTLFVSILVALAIATILGAFAENVKSVQSLLAPLIILVMIPYFLTLLVDLERASGLVRAVVFAIPFSHAFSAAPNLFLDNRGLVLLGIGYQLVWFAVLVLVAARLFSSDRILTLKLDLRRLRKR